MNSRDFEELCQRLSRGEIAPGDELDRVGNGARIGLHELSLYLSALEAAYRRKCRDNMILQARIRTLEQERRTQRGTGNPSPTEANGGQINGWRV